MTYLKNLAILIFDLIDHYIHQKNIIKALKKEKLKIEIFFDIGAHKGKYTDLILKEYTLLEGEALKRLSSLFLS